MKWEIKTEDIHTSFRDEVEELSGESFGACYQCGKCSAGCPIAFAMDHGPTKIMRFCQLGMEDEVINSDTPWLCASCQTCTTRCPREIDIAEVMDILRIIAKRRGIKPRTDPDIALFTEIFLSNLRWFGRIYELGLVGEFNLLSGRFFKDFGKAPAMFLKRKLALLPSNPFRWGKVREIFKKCEKMKEGEGRE